jgi:hypothetical protein
VYIVVVQKKNCDKRGISESIDRSLAFATTKFLLLQQSRNFLRSVAIAMHPCLWIYSSRRVLNKQGFLECRFEVTTTTLESEQDLMPPFIRIVVKSFACQRARCPYAVWISKQYIHGYISSRHEQTTTTIEWWYILIHYCIIVWVKNIEATPQSRVPKNYITTTCVSSSSKFMWGGSIPCCSISVCSRSIKAIFCSISVSSRGYYYYYY